MAQGVVDGTPQVKEKLKQIEQQHPLYSHPYSMSAAVACGEGRGDLGGQGGGGGQQVVDGGTAGSPTCNRSVGAKRHVSSRWSVRVSMSVRVSRSVRVNRNVRARARVSSHCCYMSHWFPQVLTNQDSTLGENKV